jgi:hypothetical protein
VLNLFNLTKKTGSIHNFGYIVECHRKKLIKIRNNMGACESVGKLVAFSLRCDIYHCRLWSGLLDINPIGPMCIAYAHA